MARINKIKNLGKADLHIHSNYSDGKPSIEHILDYAENQTDLDIIAITDHNTIEGAKKAKKIAKEKNYRIQVIIGEEVTTTEGHILGLFLKKTIPAGLSTRKALIKIKEQKGISITPHPFFYTDFQSSDKILMNGVGSKTLIENKKLINGIEVINGTPTLADENIKADILNDFYLFKSETGSSDAHIAQMIGYAYTVFEGHCPKNLKIAILKGQTKAMTRRFGILTFFRYIFFFIPKGLRILFYTMVHGKNHINRDNQVKN